MGRWWWGVGRERESESESESVRERESVNEMRWRRLHETDFFFRPTKKRTRHTMGRAPADRPLKVNPKRGPGTQAACGDELAAFLACMMVRG